MNIDQVYFSGPGKVFVFNMDFVAASPPTKRLRDSAGNTSTTTNPTGAGAGNTSTTTNPTGAGAGNTTIITNYYDY